MTNITLRDVIPADLPIFFDDQLDPQATEMAAFPSRTREVFMTHWAKILADPTLIQQTVLADGHVAGNIVCYPDDGRRYVGYWISKQWWGQGIATQALTALLQQVTLRPLYAYVAKHNLGSLRVLQKCGFAICDVGTQNADIQPDEVEEILLVLNR